MSRQEKIRNKRTLRNISIIFICMIGIMLVGMFFISFSDHLDNDLDDSASEGIEETYKEVGQLVTSISQSRINYLEMLGDYFEIGYLNNDTYQKVINDYKQLCGFTNYYMMNVDGSYFTLDGESGTIDFGNDLSKIQVKTINNLIITGILPDESENIFYIYQLPNEEAYNGQSYTLVSFGYDKQDLINSLKINAYRGEGISYITYDNGEIICRLDSQTITTNVFEILKYSNIKEDKYNQVVDDFAHGKTKTIKIKGTTEGFGEYYFSYQPLKYQDWILVSLVPTDIANNAANSIRNQMTLAIGGIFLAITLILTLSIVFSFKNAIKSKDGLILQRNILFDLMCNDLNEIYVLFNTKTKEVEYVSPNVEKMTGLSNNEIFDDASKLIIYNDNKSTTLSMLINNFVYDNSNEHKEEVYINNSHNKKIMYSLNITKQTNSLFGILVLSDRTEENRVRQELKDALEGAKSADRAKSTFLSSVSHDMRTPMNAIIGFSNLIEKEPNNAKQVLEYASKIKLSSNHLLNLINEVLDYSKVEAGKTTLNIEPTNMEVIVNSVDSIIRPQALDKNQTFSLNTNYQKKALVNADELRITQVLINVLSNAIKYTQEGGIINFDVKSRKYHQFIEYTFVIEDNGYGMSPEFVKKIFDPFSREENSTTNKIQGTGLGMSITKNLIDLMGGTIEVESKKGEGSKFTITIPFTPANESEVTQKLDLNSINEDYSIKDLNILAAEDNELNCEIIKAIIESEGANITLVDNGKECYETFLTSKSNEFDLILMDVQMPIMDGYEATNRIRNSEHPDAKTIPIIAMTANAFLEDIQNSKKAGMDGHVTKPIDIKVLKNTIKECLNK